MIFIATEILLTRRSTLLSFCTWFSSVLFASGNKKDVATLVLYGSIIWDCFSYWNFELVVNLYWLLLPLVSYELPFFIFFGLFFFIFLLEGYCVRRIFTDGRHFYLRSCTIQSWNEISRGTLNARGKRVPLNGNFTEQGHVYRRRDRKSGSPSRIIHLVRTTQ